MWDEEQLENLSMNPLKSGQKFDMTLRISAAEEFVKNSPMLTATITFEYSGGVAFRELYGRRSAISFVINLVEEQVEEPHAEAE